MNLEYKTHLDDELQHIMDYFSDIYIGYLSEHIIRDTMQLALLKCNGCVDGMKSPILHQHIQLNLLEKLRVYFEEVRGSVLASVPELYDQFKHKLAHSDDELADRDLYISTGRQFLITITPDAVYYGRFVTDSIDKYIDEGFIVPKKSRKRRSRN